MLEVIFAVFAKAGMKSKTEQSIWTALVEELGTEIGKKRFFIALRLFFQKPNFSGLVHNEEGVVDPRDLGEPDEAGANIARGMDERMGEAKFLAKEGLHRDGTGKDR